MNQQWYKFGILAALLAPLMLSGPPMVAAQQVPFKGRSSGVVTTTGSDPVAKIAHTRLEGEGEATHLGRFTAIAIVDVDLVTGNAHGSWTLTAANGDRLFLTMTASPGIDSTHGVAALTVVGGTGRFEGATGAYKQTITFDVTPGSSDRAAYTDVLEGMISFGHHG